MPFTVSLKKYLSIFFETISVIAFCVIIILLILQVLFRYVFRVSVPWTEELARYFTIWMVYLGAALAYNDDDHIKIDFFIKKFKNKILIKFVEYLEMVVISIFALSLWLGALLLVEVGMRDWASTLPIQMGWVYLALPVSLIIIIVFIILKSLTHSFDNLKVKEYRIEKN